MNEILHFLKRFVLNDEKFCKLQLLYKLSESDPILSLNRLLTFAYWNYT